VGSELEVAQADVAEVQQEVNKLEAELQQATDEITRRWDEVLDHLASDEIAPQRNNIKVQELALAWRPAWLITYNSEGVNDTAAVAAYSTAESL
jgi:phage-related minor tail protein